MPQINVAATANVGAVQAITAPAADGAAASSDPFVAILQQQIAATTTTDPLLAALAANAETATETAADPLDQALLALAAAMQAGAVTTAADDSRSDDPATAVALLADPLATQPIAAPLILAGSVSATAEIPLPTAATAATGPALAPDATAKGTAILAAEPEVLVAESTFAGKLEAATSLLTPPEASTQAAANARQASNHVVLPASIPLATPVASRAWGSDVANSVAWMVGQNQSRAELVLTPPELGRVEISISVSGDQATASFVSASPAVREALENALPRLREVLAEAGVTLAQAHVGAETSEQSAKQQENGDNPTWNQASPALGSDMAPAARAAQAAGAWYGSGRGMIDVFA
jgi:flagellar hook-length control protein FliK